MSDFSKIKKREVKLKLTDLIKKNTKVIVIKKYSSVKECKQLIDYCHNNSVPYKHRILDKKKDFWTSIDIYPVLARTRRIFKAFEFGKKTERKFKVLEEITKFQYEYLYKDMLKKKVHSRYVAYQYPKGGGFFSKHRHPRWPTNYGIILNLSKNEKDFKKGGITNFYFKKKKILINKNDIDQGDLTLFRYDLFHEVPPVDPEEILRFDKTGRWTVTFPILYVNPWMYKKKQRPR